jgi:hypothetical protein
VGQSNDGNDNDGNRDEGMDALIRRVREDRRKKDAERKERKRLVEQAIESLDTATPFKSDNDEESVNTRPTVLPEFGNFESKIPSDKLTKYSSLDASTKANNKNQVTVIKSVYKFGDNADRAASCSISDAYLIFGEATDEGGKYLLKDFENAVKKSPAAQEVAISTLEKKAGDNIVAEFYYPEVVYVH